MAKVILVRPGSTDFDAERRIQGALDLPLNDRGRAEVLDTAQAVAHFPMKAIFTDPADPASSSAKELGRRLDVPVRATDGLRNMDHGLWQGLQVEELRRKFPRVFKQWRTAPETICPPDGEMVSDAVGRIRSVLAKALKRHATFAVVASEPLATLIGCVLRGKKPDLAEWITNGRNGTRWEVIETNGQFSANGAASRSPCGRDGAG